MSSRTRMPAEDVEGGDQPSSNTTKALEDLSARIKGAFERPVFKRTDKEKAHLQDLNALQPCDTEVDALQDSLYDFSLEISELRAQLRIAQKAFVILATEQQSISAEEVLGTVTRARTQYLEEARAVQQAEALTDEVDDTSYASGGQTSSETAVDDADTGEVEREIGGEREVGGEREMEDA